MAEILELFKAASGMTPLGVIAMLVAVVWLLVKGRKDVQNLGDNHLHDMPELIENSRRTVDVLQRIEVRLGENFAAIRERLDG